MTTHSIGLETFHYLWSNEHKPNLRIASGDEVHFIVNEVASWQIKKDSGVDSLANFDPDKLYPLSGPVYIEDAKPGDALSVEIVEVKTADWGWSAIIPGLGLLPEFTEPYLWIWDLSKNDKFANFRNGIKVPLEPFCGVMGVAPKEKGAFLVGPPGRHGGNMDIKHLTAGSRLFLPIWTNGALFSVGDIHAAMGDGEVCVTAIECPGDCRLKFELVKGANISSPYFITKKKDALEDSEFQVTTGISSDLMEASRLATRNMIQYLVKEHNLTREDAYILCSVAGDLKIHEIVDAPNWVVGFWMPQKILRF